MRSAERRRDEGAVKVPDRFLRVRYNGAAHPQAHANGLRGGANCQRFVFEVLRHFGFEMAPMRSSELWTDRTYTRVVRRMRSFDILLFNRRENAWGAHLALCLGDGRAIHLSKSLGLPAVWRVAEFARQERYRVLVAIQRPIRRRRARINFDRYRAERLKRRSLDQLRRLGYQVTLTPLPTTA